MKEILQLINAFATAIVLTFSSVGVGYSLINYNRICVMDIEYTGNFNQSNPAHWGYALSYPSSKLSQEILKTIKGCEK